MSRALEPQEAAQAARRGGGAVVVPVGSEVRKSMGFDGGSWGFLGIPGGL